MNRLAPALLVVALVVAGVVIGSTSSALPGTVASHFGAGGLPNGAMSREGYVAIMIAVAVGLPLLVLGFTAWLPRISPRTINIPNRDYWLAPERRATTFAYLTAHACWMGIALAAFVTALHLIIINANSASPPRLPTAEFVPLLVVFVTFVVLGGLLLILRFRRTS
jgi:hypothetical protein